MVASQFSRTMPKEMTKRRAPGANRAGPTADDALRAGVGAGIIGIS
jgi:hypothetical protein